ncbi:MarR family transcriptional regulator [Streptomyces profundus]|nr:MarR family transcriptional regulator [Streptomyces sp. MA3_2.13]
MPQGLGSGGVALTAGRDATPKSAGGPSTAEAHVVERLGGRFARTGLSRTPARGLAAPVVSEEGALTAAERCRRLGVSSGTVSTSVQHLSGLGLVTRENVPGSRRERYRVLDDPGPTSSPSVATGSASSPGAPPRTSATSKTAQPPADVSPPCGSSPSSRCPGWTVPSLSGDATAPSAGPSGPPTTRRGIRPDAVTRTTGDEPTDRPPARPSRAQPQDRGGGA